VRFGITARQFNSVCRNLKGKVESIRSNQKRLIKEAEQRIKKADKTIKHLEKEDGNANKLHQKKRRLAKLRARHQRMVDDQKAGRVRICFGSRKLFRAQFDLQANGYASLGEWRADWRAERSSQFHVLGSKDETAGCQGCVAEYLGEQWLRLRLRLPNALVDANGGDKYRRFDVRLNYGVNHLVAALTLEKAVSYRFKRDAKGWRVFITVDDLPFEKVSDKRRGAIGVDLNADHLAVAETDRYGNLVNHCSIPLVTYGCDRNQADARIGDVIKEVMAFADGKNKPLVVENLSFDKKKAQLEGWGGQMSRMLSSLSYSKILAVLQARAHDAGLEVKKINPAYTSVIGRWKFANRYGVSGHQAAAIAIARRALRLSERPNRRDHNASVLPARNRTKHVWAYWARVARMKPAAHVAQQPSRPSPRFTPPPGPLDVPFFLGRE
jgi:IS605 OrfB family transposase